MSSHLTLLAEIDAFLLVSQMSESSFGHKTVNDGKLVARLRSGKGLTLKSADRIREFIAAESAHKPAPPGHGRAAA